MSSSLMCRLIWVLNIFFNSWSLVAFFTETATVELDFSVLFFFKGLSLCEDSKILLKFILICGKEKLYDSWKTELKPLVVSQKSNTFGVFDSSTLAHQSLFCAGESHPRARDCLLLSPGGMRSWTSSTFASVSFLYVGWLSEQKTMKGAIFDGGKEAEKIL